MSFDSHRNRKALSVLHVVPSLALEHGGPAVAVPALTSALAREGLHCEIFTTDQKGVATGSPIPSSTVPVHRFDVGFLARFWLGYSSQLAKALWKQMQDGAFDLVHIHEAWHYPGFVAFRAARKHDVPYVLSPHGEFDEFCLGQKAFKKKMYMGMVQDQFLNAADALHALTVSEMASLSALGYKTPVFVAPVGIDPCPFEHLSDISGFLAAYPELSGKFVILFMGRLHSKKGLDVLARSYARIASKYRNTVLLVAGPDEGGTQKKMEAILKTSPASSSTVFTGLLTGRNKLAALRCADLFVLPSYSEGFSTAILEALAAGLPVVISKQSNFPEVSEHNAGFVVEPNDVAVTEAISTLLSDEQLRARMGCNGRDLVREKYTWSAIAASMAGLYRRLIDRRAAKGNRIGER